MAQRTVKGTIELSRNGLYT